MPGQDKLDQLERIEKFCIKTGSLATLCSLSAFGFAIGHGLLLFGYMLSTYIRSQRAATVLLVIFLGLLLGWLVTNIIWKFFGSGGWSIAVEIITDQLDVPSRESHPAGLLLGYLFLSFVGSGIYSGLYGYALRVVSFTGMTGRVADTNHLLASGGVLLLDWGSAFGFVAMIAGTVAFNTRIFWIIQRYTPDDAIVRRLLFPSPSVGRWIRRTLPRSVLQSESELTGPMLVHDFTARMGLAGLFVSGLSLVCWQVLETSCFSQSRCTDFPRTILVIVVIGIVGASVLAFLVGFVWRVAGMFKTIPVVQRYRSLVVSSLDTTSRVLTLHTRNPLYSVLLGSIFAAVCLVFYGISVFLLPAGYPSTLPPFSRGLAPSSIHVTLAEVVRVASVVGVVSYPVSVTIRGREWWSASTVRKRYGSFRSILETVARFTSQVSTSINGVGERERPSKWAPWVRAGLLAQMFAAGGTMASISRNRFEPAIAGLVIVLLLIQAATVAQDLRAQRNRLGWQEKFLVVSVLLVPVVGAFIYVVREYWPSERDDGD